MTDLQTIYHGRYFNPAFPDSLPMISTCQCLVEDRLPIIYKKINGKMLPVLPLTDGRLFVIEHAEEAFIKEIEHRIADAFDTVKPGYLGRQLVRIYEDEEGERIGVYRVAGTLCEITLPGMFADDALAEMIETFAPVRYETPGWDRGGFDEEQTTTFYFKTEEEAVAFKLRWS